MGLVALAYGWACDELREPEATAFSRLTKVGGGEVIWGLRVVTGTGFEGTSAVDGAARSCW